MCLIFYGGHRGEGGDWAADGRVEKDNGNIFQWFSYTNLGRKIYREGKKKIISMCRHRGTRWKLYTSCPFF